MPTVVTNYFKTLQSNEQISLSADSFYVALINQNISATNLATLTSFSGISNSFEVSSTNYNAGGKSLSGVTIITNNNILQWNGSNLSWSNVSFTVYGCCIYRHTDSVILGFIDFGQSYTTQYGNFTISWNSNGILNEI